MRRTGDFDEAIIMTALAVTGLVQMLLHPRKTLRLLQGVGWYD